MFNIYSDVWATIQLCKWIFHLWKGSCREVDRCKYKGSFTLVDRNWKMRKKKCFVERKEQNSFFPLFVVSRNKNVIWIEKEPFVKKAEGKNWGVFIEHKSPRLCCWMVRLRPDVLRKSIFAKIQEFKVALRKKKKISVDIFIFCVLKIWAGKNVTPKISINLSLKMSSAERSWKKCASQS